MNIARHFCAILGLLSVLNSSASEAPYPEVFDEFITGWVDYDDGYYAAALRAFFRAHSLDPEFRPATEAIAASLVHMGMPEISEAILRDGWISKGSKINYSPAIAFWGVFHGADFDSISTAGLEKTITDTLNDLVDLPIVLTSPSTKTWAERKKHTPCEYNMLIFLFKDEEQEYAVARIHLIRNYSVATGKELDLALSTVPSQVAHQKFEINLNPEDVAQLSDNAAFNEGILELFDLNVEIENPAYRIDPETHAPLNKETDPEPLIYISKASASTEFALQHYETIKKLCHKNSRVMAAVGAGFSEWLAHQLETTHPMRPWLLAEADRENTTGPRWHLKKAAQIREELARDHPGHPALLAVQLCREAWNLHHLNYEEKMPIMLPLVEKLRQMPPELFTNHRDLEYLERFEKTIRACLGLPTLEPFVPIIIKRGSQRMTNDGSYRLSFSGKVPVLMEEEVHEIGDHRAFALEALIDQMASIDDTSVVFSLYKKHVDREDALGAYLRRTKNWVMWRFRWGNKETRKEASEWWIQRAVDVVESDAPLSEIAKTLPAYYLDFSDYNQPLTEAIDRRLAQRGMLQVDENASFARRCTMNWKIPFQDLSPKSQQIVIRYHRTRALEDFEGYFTLLTWLRRSNVKQLLSAEAQHAQAAYIHKLNAESDRVKRVKLANRYGTLLVAAEEYQMALDVCEFVFPDLVIFEDTENKRSQWLAYSFLTLRIKALVGLGRLDEAVQEIDRIIQEVDGQLIHFPQDYGYDLDGNGRQHSLSSRLLEIKSEIQNHKQ